MMICGKAISMAAIFNNPPLTASFGGVAVAALFATFVLEASELLFLITGAFAYTLWKVRGESKRQLHTVGKVLRCSSQEVPEAKARPVRKGAIAGGKSSRRRDCVLLPAVKPDRRQPSVVPIVAPIFSSSGWESEVDELVGQLLPTPEGDAVVQRLVRRVKETLSPMIPTVEVSGFTSGNPTCSKAFGVAIPEVDIVVSASQATLLQCLQNRLSDCGHAAVQNDVRKLQKAAIRACTDELVSVGGFKFRRSAFQAEEPKVTLLAPALIGASQAAVPIDFMVNSHTSIRSTALLTECGRFEPNAKALILFVRRWARDRGISHAPKGHLPPYAWSLLTMYFLQVGTADGVRFLPRFKGLAATPTLVAQAGDVAAKPTKACSPSRAKSSEISVGTLFKDFVRFYTHEFDWHNEAISVRLGQRAPPNMSLHLHNDLRGDGCTSQVCPNIEDPFDVTRNLSSSMTASGFARLQQELSRADALCSYNSTLTELLEPWTPSDDDGKSDEPRAQPPPVQSAQQSVPRLQQLPTSLRPECSSGGWGQKKPSAKVPPWRATLMSHAAA